MTPAPDPYGLVAALELSDEMKRSFNRYLGLCPHGRQRAGCEDPECAVAEVMES